MLRFSFSLRFLLLSFAATACAVSVYLGTGINSLHRTENDFDVAIVGEGFFQVNEPEGGESRIHYTRCGKFQLDPERQLCIYNEMGYWRTEPQISIPEDARKVDILPNGNVYVFEKSSPTRSCWGCLQLARFNHSDDIVETSSGIFTLAPNAANGPTTSDPGSNGTGFLQQGWVTDFYPIGNHWLATATFLFGMLITTGIEVLGRKSIVDSALRTDETINRPSFEV